MLGMRYSVVLHLTEPKEVVEYLCQRWEPDNGFLMLHNAVPAQEYYHGGPIGDKKLIIIPSNRVLVAMTRELPND